MTLHCLRTRGQVEPLDTFLKFVPLATMVAVALGVFAYWRNARLERSKWLSSLYEKFYERDHLKNVREILDKPAEDEAIHNLVEQESAAFTDYLNFFEFVAYLNESGQILDRDVDALFHYYLKCLRDSKSVRDYIASRDFEKLGSLLRRLR